MSSSRECFTKSQQTTKSISDETTGRTEELILTNNTGRFGVLKCKVSVDEISEYDNDDISEYESLVDDEISEFESFQDVAPVHAASAVKLSKDKASVETTDEVMEEEIEEFDEWDEFRNCATNALPPDITLTQRSSDSITSYSTTEEATLIAPNVYRYNSLTLFGDSVMNKETSIHASPDQRDVASNPVVDRSQDKKDDPENASLPLDSKRSLEDDELDRLLRMRKKIRRPGIPIAVPGRDNKPNEQGRQRKSNYPYKRAGIPIAVPGRDNKPNDKIRRAGIPIAVPGRDSNPNNKVQPTSTMITIPHQLHPSRSTEEAKTNKPTEKITTGQQNEVKTTVATISPGEKSDPADIPSSFDSKRSLRYDERYRLLCRKKARRPGNPIAVPGGDTRSKEKVQPTTKKMTLMQQFFASLLHLSPKDLMESENSEVRAKEVLYSICKQLELEPPTEALPSICDSVEHHCKLRAALIMEEARAILAQSLIQNWSEKTNQQTSNGGNRKDSEKMILHSDEIIYWLNGENPTVTFSNTKSCFTREQLFHIRTGSIFRFVPILESMESINRTSTHPIFNHGLLGVAVGSVTATPEDAEKDNKFTCKIFRSSDFPSESSMYHIDWVVSPVCSLLSEFRCFEAMIATILLNKLMVLPFMSNLLGKKNLTGKEIENVKNKKLLDSGIGSNTRSVRKTKKSSSQSGSNSYHGEADDSSTKKGKVFHRQKLNSSQKEAAKKFLQSKEGEVTIVQGPPGTGKTTLLVEIICQHLSSNQRPNQKQQTRPLMVCAPTNKAISILATKFMAAYRKKCKGQFNAALIGDGDKLLMDERSKRSESSEVGNDDTFGDLEAIFHHNWKQKMVEDYNHVKTGLFKDKLKRNIRRLAALSQQLEKRLSRLFSLDRKIMDQAIEISALLRDIEANKSVSSSLLNCIFDKISMHILDIRRLPETLFAELLLTADVIFCTLCCAGRNNLRSLNITISDLIVDEAAAATEPELFVPFFFKPRRLLLVGDPLQLPATVMSRRAVQFGLAKSLQERLMIDCSYEHCLLNKQYRMNPSISKFPSFNFYKSRIADSNHVKEGKHKEYDTLLLENHQPYCFLQVDGSEERSDNRSFYNRAEASKVVELVLRLRCQAESKINPGPSWYTSERIRVITFYQAQVALIKRMLSEKGLGNKIVVATVDASQGCEADIVILSFVRSRLNDFKDCSENKSYAGFLTDDRRVNVALTRAKHQLIGIGNINQFSKMSKNAPTLHKLASDALKRKIVQGSSSNK